MRVLVVALALAVAPLGVSAAQAPGARPSGRAAANFADPDCGHHLTPVVASQGKSRGMAGIPVHNGIHGAADYPCAPPPPPPPPPAEEPPPPTGLIIDGSVFNGLDATPLANWVIELSGTVAARATSNASGNYQFAGLPPGTYLVCQVVPDGWVASFPRSGPTCPTGFGHTFTLLEGQGASMVNFKAIPQ